MGGALLSTEEVPVGVYWRSTGLFCPPLPEPVITYTDYNVDIDHINMVNQK